jgi:hypothetical protein
MVRPQKAALVSGGGWWWSGRRGGSNIASTSAMCVRALMSFVLSKRSPLPRAREGTRPGTAAASSSSVPCLPRLKLDFNLKAPVERKHLTEHTALHCHWNKKDLGYSRHNESIRLRWTVKGDVDDPLPKVSQARPLQLRMHRIATG